MSYFNLEIASTSTCNMACTYCFEGEELQSKQVQPKESIPKIILKIKELLDSEKFNNEYPRGICINFWGGEPTLNFEWNKELIETTRKLFGKKVSYFIYSNGFDYKKLAQHIDLFTNDDLLYNRLRVQISYDGIPNGRIQHNGKSTNELVENHIKTFALMYPELQLTTKATIQPEELKVLETIWRKFYDLYKSIKSGESNRTIVTFSPTLNYVDNFDDTNEEYIKEISSQFQKVTVLEDAFYRKNSFHLFGWFSENFKEARGKRLTNCSAGINMMAIDYSGQVSSCHGVLYSDKKKDFESFHDMNINQPEEVFIPKFFKSRELLKKHTEHVTHNCITCEATVCYKCPVINIEQIGTFSPENYQVRDTRHCQIYKTFGRYDRVLMTLKLNKRGL